MSQGIHIPYVDLAGQNRPLKEEILEVVARVLEHGWYILGPELEQLENRFAELCHVQHAIGVQSGTAALYLVMKGLGIGPGDEVITAPNSFLASASSIALTGATPVFVDVQRDMNIDPNQLGKKICKKTRAIMPVHLTGRPADMDVIGTVAKEYGLHVIEDAAQAVGAYYHEKPVGGLGTAGCFSFHPLKNLAAVGDGGIITTNNGELAEWLKLSRNHGLESRDTCRFWSYNLRMDALQAAIVNKKMDYLQQWTERRRAIANQYHDGLQDTVQVPKENKHIHSVYHTYIIQCDHRDALQAYLKGRGIETKIHYPIPIHLQPAASEFHYKVGDFPIAEEQSKRILSLPVYPELTDSMVQQVIQMINQFYELMR